MPRIVVEGRPQRDRLVLLRMVKCSRELCLRHRIQNLHPFGVQTVEHGEDRFDQAGATVLKFNPVSFFVRLNRGKILREGPLEANQTVKMTIGQVVRDLANRPVAGLCVQLFLTQTIKRLSEIAWSGPNSVDKPPRQAASYSGINSKGSAG